MGRWRKAAEPRDNCPIRAAIVAMRVRRALKWLLRTNGLRCIDVAEMPPPTPAPPAANRAGGNGVGVAGGVDECIIRENIELAKSLAGELARFGVLSGEQIEKIL